MIPGFYIDKYFKAVNHSWYHDKKTGNFGVSCRNDGKMIFTFIWQSDIRYILSVDEFYSNVEFIKLIQYES